MLYNKMDAGFPVNSRTIFKETASAVPAMMPIKTSLLKIRILSPAFVYIFDFPSHFENKLIEKRLINGEISVQPVRYPSETENIRVHPGKSI